MDDPSLYNDIPEITPIENYNIEEGKIRASVKWLIACIFERNIPDKLQNAFCRNDSGQLQFTATMVTALTNGTLYAQAAAKVFHEQALIKQGLTAVLVRISADLGTTVTDVDNAAVTEHILQRVDPIQTTAHLAVIDSLMSVYVRSVITTENTVGAVQRYTSVDKREEPIDSVDALLFWINKICLLVRDDIDKASSSSTADSSPVVPEMEDLYEDLCDGACICALTAFYRPQQLQIDSVCFNDPMSIGDCQYNLLLLRRFSAHHLPWDIFHFEIEDILYLHENLQLNINTFLTDLFQFFEGPFPLKADSTNSTPIPSPASATTHAVNRFTPLNIIPDLRGVQHSARKASHPPPVKQYPGPGMAAGRVGRAMSTVSTDSLMTNRSDDSLLFPNARHRHFRPDNLTTAAHFGDHIQNAIGDTAYVRSDSLPQTSASIRLAMEEKRRDLEKQKLLRSSINETTRHQTGKDAFFTLMGRQQHQPTGQIMQAEYGHEDDHHHPNNTNKNEIRFLNETVNRLQEQVNQMSVAQVELARHVDDSSSRMATISHAISQPSIYNDGLSSSPIVHHHQQQQQQQFPTFHTAPMQYPQHQQFFTQSPRDPHLQQQYFPTGYVNHPPAQQHTYAQPFANPAQPQQSPMFHPNFQSQSMSPGPANTVVERYSGAYHISPSLAVTNQQISPYMQHNFPPPPSNDYNNTNLNQPQQGQQNFDAGGETNTFRLHQQDASTSRLDPALELHRNLTNWGLTYKNGHTVKPQRRTWEHETFIKSEMDLVNQPDVVPHAPHERDQSRAQSIVDDPTMDANCSRRELSSSSFNNSNDANRSSSFDLRERDETLKQNRSTANGGVMSRSMIATNKIVVLDDPTYNNATSAPRLSREMEAKRSALLAKTMRRKEQIEQKVEETEARNADRRLAEQQKQEQSEQKRIEKEQHRQKIMENYLKKKLEKEQLADSGSPTSARLSSSSPSSARGRSQPPLRPKSQLLELDRSIPLASRPMRPQSSADDENEHQPPGSARTITIPSIAEPSLKLFTKHTPKSNRNIISNALHFSVFNGAVHDEQRNKVLAELAKNDSKHFLLLFRDHKCQFRGLYSWDQLSDVAHKIAGAGPKFCKEDMMNLMFKYDSGAKSFSTIPTRHLSATIDGFTVQDQFWQKAKIPHAVLN